MMNNMKKIFRKTIVLLLTAAFVLQGTGCMCAPLGAASVAAAGYILAKEATEPEPSATAIPEDAYLPETKPEIVDSETEVGFSDMVYSRPDTSEIRNAIQDLKDKILQGNVPTGELFKDYETIMGMYRHLDSESSLAYLLYSLDVTTSYYKDEYDYVYAEMNSIDLLLIEIAQLLAESEQTAGEMKEIYGDAYIEHVYKAAKQNSPEIQEDLKEEEKLVGQYDALLTGYVLEDGGREYTLEDIAEVASDDYEEYSRLYGAYCAGLNRKAGEIYLKILKIRARIADKLGYSNYAEYMYDAYDRDYSCREIRNLEQVVKDEIVPIYQKAVLRAYMMNGFSNKGSDNIPFSTFLNRFAVILKDFSPEMEDSLQYMRRNGLCLSDVSEKKMEGSFTTYIDDYQAPCIMTQYEGTGNNAQTIIHEFGHFANFHLNTQSGWNTGSYLDCCEVDSQGLEMLMLHYYDQLFGESGSSLRTDKLNDMMYSIISGFMEDEFQQEIYSHPDMTLEDLNALYLQLSEEYGFTTLYGFTGLEWVMIPHTFQSPMYYISYGVSAIAALEIWALSEKDFSQAKDIYLKVQQRPSYSPLRTVAQDNGLSDPVSARTLRSLASSLQAAGKPKYEAQG